MRIRNWPTPSPRKTAPPVLHGSFLQPDRLRDATRNVARAFADVATYVAAVPTYPSGSIAGSASQSLGLVLKTDPLARQKNHRSRK